MRHGQLVEKDLSKIRLVEKFFLRMAVKLGRIEIFSDRGVYGMKVELAVEINC